MRNDRHGGVRSLMGYPAAEEPDPALAELTAKGFFHPPRFGAYRLTRPGRFRCAAVAGELMECAARAWEQ